MHRRTNVVFWLILVGAFGAAGLACKSREIKPLEDLFDRSGRLPDNFPKEIPVYPGAKITRTMLAHATDGGMKDGCLVWLETADAPSKVTDF